MRFIKKATAYIQWIKTWRQIPVAPWVSAGEYFKIGRFEDAARFYKIGLESYPDHSAAYAARLDLSYCLFRGGDLPAAEEELKKSIKYGIDTREATLRLAQLQLWTGASVDAVWTLKKYVAQHPNDAEAVGRLILAQLERGAPLTLVKEVVDSASNIIEGTSSRGGHLLAVARARYALAHGEFYNARAELFKLAKENDTSVEALMALAEFLLSDDQIPAARQHLRRALSISSHNPRIYYLLAHSYLRIGVGYNPEFSKQLAQSACQLTGWQDARAMHLLAESYLHAGDKMAALLMASRARDALSQPLLNYSKIQDLDKLIQDLSGSTVN